MFLHKPNRRGRSPCSEQADAICRSSPRCWGIYLLIATSAGAERVVPLNISLIPSISVAGSGDSVVSNVSWGFVTRTARIEGASFGAVNIHTTSVRGLQSSWFVGTCGGPVEGAQASTLVSYARGGVRGVQTAVIVSKAGGSVDGLQVTGLLSFASAAGTQVSGFMSHAPSAGTQVSGFMSHAAEAGNQASGFMSYASSATT